MLRDRKTLFTSFIILLFITACATTPRTGGVYHSVKKGETLWRIARAYNCDPNEIARVNNLPDTTIEAGSALFIPDATEPISITPETQDTATASKEIHRVQEKTLGPAPADVSTAIPEKDTPTPSRESYRPSFTWPVEGTVSSKFGTYKGMRHNGIRIDAEEGTPVLAAADGTVIYSAPMKYFGETIIIKHNDTYSTVYYQFKERMAGVDSAVKKGEQIGTVGKEEKADKTYLNFEIRYRNRAKDPLHYLPKKK